MKTLKNLINQSDILKLHKIFNQYSGEIRLVGGCVRDALLGRAVQDLDVATDLPPNQVIKILSANNIKCIPTGIKHGTVTAVLHDNSIEITTLRRDINCDGRHAIIEFTNNWQEDAARRDFTFNALYCDMGENIYDYFDGLKDLTQRKINFVGNTEHRICEDYLRILRAFRFYAQINCQTLSDEILGMCKKYAYKLNILSGERIKREMINLLKCSSAIETLAVMQSCDVLSEILPINLNINSIKQVQFHSDNAFINLAFILRASKNHDSCERIYEKWRLSRKEYKILYNLCNTELVLNDGNQKANIRKFGKALYLAMLSIYNYEGKIDDQELTYNMELAKNWKIPKFPLSGKDLIIIGYKADSNLNVYLNEITNYWEKNHYLLNKDDLIKYAKSILLR